MKTNAPRMIAAVLFSGAVFLSTTGCAHSLTQAEIKYLETRSINGSYEHVYHAALNAIFSMGMTIQHSDKSSGVVSGQSGDHGQRAIAQSSKSRYAVKKVTILVTPEGPRTTQVRMKVLVNEKQQLDRKLMTAIWQRIEREALLDENPSFDRPARGQSRAHRTR